MRTHFKIKQAATSKQGRSRGLGASEVVVFLSHPSQECEVECGVGRWRSVVVSLLAVADASTPRLPALPLLK